MLHKGTQRIAGIGCRNAMLRLRYRENCFVGILLDHTRLWELFTACQDRVSCSRSSRERVLRSTSLKWSWDEEKGRACQQHKAPSVSSSPVRVDVHTAGGDVHGPYEFSVQYCMRYMFA